MSVFLESTRPRVGTTALTRTHFLLLYAAMLVAASGNTALQSVMPAIGREIGVSDFWVAVAYTWSAVLWVLLAPYWAEKSDHHGRKALTLLGPERVHRIHALVRTSCICGTGGSDRRRADIRPVRDFPGDLRRLRLRDAFGDPGLSRIQDPAQRARCGAVRTCLPRSASERSSARRSRPFRAAFRRSRRAPVRVLGDRTRRSSCDPAVAAERPRTAGEVGRGAAMSYPSRATQPTGASVVAATSPQRRSG